MNINDINIILNTVLRLGLCIFLGIMIYKLFIFVTKRITDIQNKKIEHEKIKLYSTIDASAVKTELETLIRDYISRYMIKNIMINHIDIIKNDQMDQMTKDVTKDVILNMSDMYLQYCKLLYNINNEDDLTNVIYYLTVDIVLDVVTKFNNKTN